ncbi:MAG: hypothetical protein HYX48_00910 [Chlamydiales bacterium]|nr:hypothetical protein [Chlamydiales bacterium]
MKARIVLLLLASLCFSFHSSDEVYKQIKDIRRPTLQDYYLIQEYLSHGEREGLERLKDTEQRQRSFKIIGEALHEKPLSGLIAVNSKIEERENCLVLYASFNMHYPDGLRRLIQIVERSDFKGHILYHFGGWPDLAGGSLVLAHVPHAFKACCFKEAQRLGYKRVLWLDSSIFPVVSLNLIFKMIQEKGYFTIGNFHQVGPYCNADTAAHFGFTLEETYHLLSCQSGFIGVDLTTPQGREVVDLFYRAAQDKHGFFSARSDQTALSLILHKLKLTDIPDLTKVVPLKSYARRDTLFVVDRAFVQY